MFISTLKKVFRMALNLLNEPQKPRKVEIQVRDSSLDLTISELELIMTLLGQTSFRVKDIEDLYKALYKLQEQHKYLVNNQK